MFSCSSEYTSCDSVSTSITSKDWPQERIAAFAFVAKVLLMEGLHTLTMLESVDLLCVYALRALSGLGSLRASMLRYN